MAYDDQVQQRNFTKTEINKLLFAGFISYGNMAWLEDRGRTGVQVFVFSDGRYMAHQESSCDIHFATSLQNLMNLANNLLTSS